MLRISSSQLDYFGQICFEDYINRLVKVMSNDCFNSGLAKILSTSYSYHEVKELAFHLVEQAKNLLIECEGDVTPFVLLAICDDKEIRDTGLNEWIDSIIRKKEVSSEERLDAVYSLLPEEIREKVFVNLYIG